MHACIIGRFCEEQVNLREDLDWDACSIPSDLLQGGVGSYSVGHRRMMDISLPHDRVRRLCFDGCDAV